MNVVLEGQPQDLFINGIILPQGVATVQQTGLFVDGVIGDMLIGVHLLEQNGRSIIDPRWEYTVDPGLLSVVHCREDAWQCLEHFPERILSPGILGVSLDLKIQLVL